MPERDPLPAGDPFPSLSALLAERYDYLTRGLIRYRGGQPLADEWELVDTLSQPPRLFALFADRDHSAPYAARFPDLPSSTNERLTRHADLQVAIAWPQPTMQLMPDPEAEDDGRYVTVGDDRPAKPTDVALKRTGSAQLWWGAPASEPDNAQEAVGLIWEAVVRAGPNQGRAPTLSAEQGGIDPQASPLAKWLWSACEAFLRERGQTACLTTLRDPAYEREGLIRFLRERGYEAGVAGDYKSSGPPAEETVWAEKPLRE